MTKVTTFCKNNAGRDFVLGDLHGNYSDLMHLLEYVDFDTNADRLFAVGDLVDRGEDSVKCMQLLDNPWFASVRGNHEELTAYGHTNEHVKQIHKMNGGMWAYYAENVEYVAQYHDILRELPDCIEVEDSFSIIHAEPPYRKKTDLGNFTTGKWHDSQCLDGEVHLWGRYWFLNFYGRDPDKVRCQAIPRSSLVKTCYVGHTPVNKPTRLGFLVNLDTGSGKKGNLTMHCHTTGVTYTALGDDIVINNIHTYEV